MSSTAKIWTSVIVVALVALGAYGYMERSPEGQDDHTTAMNGSPASNKDASLNQDQAAIDAQMSALGSDNASMNQSFSDKPVSQSY